MQSKARMWDRGQAVGQGKRERRQEQRASQRSCCPTYLHIPTRQDQLSILLVPSRAPPPPPAGGRCLRYRQALLCPFASHDIIDLSKRKHIVLAAVAPVVFQLLLDCSCSSHFKLGAGAGRGRVPQGCEMTLKDVGRAKT